MSVLAAALLVFGWTLAQIEGPPVRDGAQGVEARNEADEPVGAAGAEKSLPATDSSDARTPAVRPSSQEAKSASDDLDTERLEEELARIARSHQGTYGVVVFDPESGEGVGVNEDEVFDAASIGTLPVLATLYRDASAGEADLGESISIRPADVQAYGTGVLQARPAGSEMSLRECAYHLIHDSDNTAWAMLYRRLGLGHVRDELPHLGADDSHYDVYGRLFTTAEDTVEILKALEDPDYTDPKLANEMLSFMTDTAFEDRLPQPLPRDGSVRVAHKVGSNASTVADAGIVFYRDSKEGATASEADEAEINRYYIVVFASGASEADARDAMRKMSYAAFQSIS